jgi:hypothetical protein
LGSQPSTPESYAACGQTRCFTLHFSSSLWFVLSAITCGNSRPFPLLNFHSKPDWSRSPAIAAHTSPHRITSRRNFRNTISQIIVPAKSNSKRLSRKFALSKECERTVGLRLAKLRMAGSKIKRDLFVRTILHSRMRVHRDFRSYHSLLL